MRWPLVALVVFLVGCQQAPAPGPAEPPVGSFAAELRAEGDQLAARAEYAAAVVKYQAAVRQAPRDSSIWFALGTALSHEGDREGTIQAFRRVLELGAPDSREVQVAQRWLVKAGVLTAVVPVWGGSESVSTTPPAEASASSESTGALRGVTEWKGVTPRAHMMVKIILAGEDGEIQGRTFARTVRLGESYAFERIPAGIYRVTAAAGRFLLWDQKVEVRANVPTVLNLTPANSPVSTEDFPGAMPRDDHDDGGHHSDRYDHARPRAWEPPPAQERQ